MAETLRAETGEQLQTNVAAQFYDRNTLLHGPYLSEHSLSARLADDFDVLVEATQPWARGDHTRPENPTVITSEAQGERLKQLHGKLGLVDAQDLANGHYDHLIVLGGLHLGNNRRLEFAKGQLESGRISTDSLVMLGGERGVYADDEDTVIAKNIRELKSRDVSDPLIRRALREGPSVIKNETDMLRLAAAVQLGEMSLKSANSQEIQFDWEGLPVLLTHTFAVAREGDPRHTTEACVADFLQIVSPSHRARIGFIATNPHIERVTRTAMRVLHKEDRQDLALLQGGPSALRTYGYDMFRGEYARNLYEDKKFRELT